VAHNQAAFAAAGGVVMTKRYWLPIVAGLALGIGLHAARAADPQPAARVFEIRTYYTFPGRLEALHKRFREHTMKMFEKHGMTNVAYWTPQDSPGKDDTLVYVISHESREAAKRNWAEFSADPEWQKIAADSQKDGKIVERVESVFLDATDYSPLK
jgi:hypothetical protein